MAIPQKSIRNLSIDQKMNLPFLCKYVSTGKFCHLHVPQSVAEFLSVILDLFILKLIFADFLRLHLVRELFLDY